MSKQVKKIEDPITVELLESLLGKIIHTPTNEHLVVNDVEEKAEPVNVWFAGTVAGYEVQTLKYDYVEDKPTEGTKVSYNVLMTDGIGYILSPDKSEVFELTDDEFVELVDEHEKKKKAKDSILLPGKDF